MAGEDFAEVARTARIEVLGDDNRGRKVGRKAGDDAGQRLESGMFGVLAASEDS